MTNDAVSYGSWSSPITADVVTADVFALSEPRIDGDDIYWIEGRPPNGRGVIVRWTNGTQSDVTPDPFDARSDVHCYGGGAYIVRDRVVYFVHYRDNQIYKQTPNRIAGLQLDWNAPVKLTALPASLFADLCVDSARRRLIAIREERPNGSATNAINTLVAIDTDTGAETTLDAGWDFYSSPALSPDGSKLAWLSWRHPNMPWTSTYLHIAEFDQAGALKNKQTVAGSDTESIFQPQWSPDGTLYFVSDRTTQFWNLYRWTGSGVQSVLSRRAEFGIPQWQFGHSTYAFASASTIIYSCNENGEWRLGRLDLGTGAAADYQKEFSVLFGVRATANTIVVGCSAHKQPAAIATVDINSGTPSPIKYSVAPAVFGKFQEHQFSEPKSIQFKTGKDEIAYAFFYPPRNDDWKPHTGEKPPLLVISHGGPTSATNSGLSLAVQFWTSRGFAVVDVNYRGSSGYGRSYREKLNGQWGVYDVDDCVAAAKHLAASGDVDGSKLAITGGSAGGYTTLCALTFRNEFKAGASYYGISDLSALAQGTHKFESRYMDSLIGPPGSPLYFQRSPINFVDKLSAPIIFLHGEKDPVVPPDQAFKMYSSLLGRKIPTCLLIFERERHGFREAAHKCRALESELLFYGMNLLRKPQYS
jgi:dipeptidyl aminopeptidase/acylaminoacyl peptidase